MQATGEQVLSIGKGITNEYACTPGALLLYIKI